MGVRRQALAQQQWSEANAQEDRGKDLTDNHYIGNFNSLPDDLWAPYEAGVESEIDRGIRLAKEAREQADREKKEREAQEREAQAQKQAQAPSLLAALLPAPAPPAPVVLARPQGSLESFGVTATKTTPAPEKPGTSPPVPLLVLVLLGAGAILLLLLED